MWRWVGALCVCGAVALACDDGGGLEVQQPALGPLSDTLDFGTIYVGAKKTLPLELENVGAGPLRLGAASVDGSTFLVGPTPELIYAGNRGLIAVTFVANQEGAWSSELRLPLDAPGTESLLIHLLGTALPALDCDDHNDCTLDRFDPDAGLCLRADREGSCDDQSACTVDDRCAGGACLGRAIDCDDGVECTRDVCDPATGCAPIGDDTLCPDDDPCTIDRCAPTGCEHPDAPDGHLCGPVYSCQTAEICLLHTCLEVPIPDGSPCDDGNRCTIGDQCNDHACGGTAVPLAPEIHRQTTMVQGALTGTFGVDRLYVSTPVAGRSRLKLIGFDVNTVAPIRTFVDLDGSAHLHALSGTVYARVSTSTAAELFVETIDASNPDRLRPIAKVSVGFQPYNDDTAMVVGDRFFFCASPTPTAPRELATVDLVDPANPGTPTFLGTGPCSVPARSFSAAHGIWVVAHNDTAFANAGINAYRLGADGSVTSIISFSFSTNGVHNYGPIEVALTDGERIVIDVENPRYFMTYDLRITGPELHYVEIPAPAVPLILLALYNRIAIFGEGLELSSMDFSNAGAPVALPNKVPIYSPVADRHQLLAVGPGRVAFNDADQRLRIFDFRGDGLLETTEVRGNGSIARVYPQSRYVVGVSKGFVTLLEPDALERISIPTLPVGIATRANSPFLIDSIFGAVGLYAPLVQSELEACSPFQWGCDQTEPTPLETRLSRYAFEFDGTFTSSIAPLGLAVDDAKVAAIDGCTGVALDDNTAPHNYLVVDRCMANDDKLHVVASIPATIPRDYAVAWARTVLHTPGYASFVGRGFAVLFDYRTIFAPLVAAEHFLSLGSVGGFLGSEFDGRYWVTTYIDDLGSTWLKVEDLLSGAPVELGRVAFDPGQGLPVRNVLHLEWPLLYVGADHHGDALLLIYALDRPTPELIAQLPLDSPAVDLIPYGGYLWLARPDGVSLLTPACGP